jgi:hypothetical protein
MPLSCGFLRPLAPVLSGRVRSGPGFSGCLCRMRAEVGRHTAPRERPSGRSLRTSTAYVPQSHVGVSRGGGAPSWCISPQVEQPVSTTQAQLPKPRDDPVALCQELVQCLRLSGDGSGE